MKLRATQPAACRSFEHFAVMLQPQLCGVAVSPLSVGRLPRPGTQHNFYASRFPLDRRSAKPATVPHMISMPKRIALYAFGSCELALRYLSPGRMRPFQSSAKPLRHRFMPDGCSVLVDEIVEPTLGDAAPVGGRYPPQGIDLRRPRSAWALQSPARP